jgi:protein subunit release factor A
MLFSILKTLSGNITNPIQQIQNLMYNYHTLEQINQNMKDNHNMLNSQKLEKANDLLRQEIDLLKQTHQQIQQENSSLKQVNKKIQ